MKRLVVLPVAATLFVLQGNLATAAPLRRPRLHSVSNGPIYLQRYNWSNFYFTAAPTMLNSEDLLYVPEGTSVELLCADGVVRDWIGAEVNNVGSICPGRSRRYRPIFGISEQWGAGDPLTPYVISPRTGQVIDARPTLHWNAVTDAEQYEVTLQRREGDRWADVWSVTSDDAFLCYPNDQPELAPGMEYTWQVSVVGSSNSAEVLADKPVFNFVGGEEAEAIERAIADVKALDIDPAEKTLILVEDIYPQHKLFARGINELRSLIDSGHKTVQAYRFLGDYAVRTGLELTAEESYLKAMQLAQTSENLEEEALTAWGLGVTYTRVGKLELAQTYLQQAKQIATEIGDSELIAKINAELERSETAK